MPLELSALKPGDLILLKGNGDLGHHRHLVKVEEVVPPWKQTQGQFVGINLACNLTACIKHRKLLGMWEKEFFEAEVLSKNNAEIVNDTKLIKDLFG